MSLGSTDRGVLDYTRMLDSGYATWQTLPNKKEANR